MSTSDIPAVKNSWAVIALILSVTGLVACAIPSVGGVILGHMGLWRANQLDGKGRAASIAAMVLGYVGIAIYATVFVLWNILLLDFLRESMAFGSPWEVPRRTEGISLFAYAVPSRSCWGCSRNCRDNP